MKCPPGTCTICYPVAGRHTPPLQDQTFTPFIREEWDCPKLKVGDNVEFGDTFDRFGALAAGHRAVLVKVNGCGTIQENNLEPGGFFRMPHNNNPAASSYIGAHSHSIYKHRVWRIVGKSKPVVTGMNCALCNNRNDYAESNQKDGTYVCFECR